MKFVKSAELDNYLNELIDKHELNLSISDLLGNIISNRDITNEKEINLLSEKFKNDKHKVFLSKISDYLDIDMSIEDNEEIFNKYIANAIHYLDEDKYLNNPYLKAIKLDKSIKFKGYELKMDRFSPYELFAYQDMASINYIEINSLGYFAHPYSFITLDYQGVTWMNITPNEIETMEKSINQIKGDVIVFGLGLGYLPFMISSKSEVKHIKVIENDPNIIKIFKDNLIDYFTNKDKIEIIQDDASNYLNKELKCDYAFIDLWHSPIDGLKWFIKFKKSEKYNRSTTYLYWLESSFYLYLRRLMMTLIEETIENQQVDYSKESNYEDHIINIYHKKTKDLVISNKAQLDKLLSEKSLIELLLND